MNRIVLLLTVITLAACHQPKQEEPDTLAVAAAATTIQPLTAADDSMQEPHRRHNISWDKVEVFEFSKALINGKVPLFTNRQRLESSIAAADSIISTANEDICGSQFDDDFSYFYIKGSTFELCKDSVACEEFVFSPDNELKLGKITLTGNTTWEEVSKLFPNAALQAENEGKTDMITLRDSYSMESDSSVQLYFENGKLVRVVNFNPC
ncbi:MAG: hypothetical protein J7623_05530 [Chitinophaga sp.]|uniref:hypothetical protein n=1 Tax=Chitinophaga sp. TaxID=1869181 RepID=UPI001B2F195D|nr:hypothetical protein [Chitinophaga sp.]MBO9728081.1 hypothetical protein [Chitinophaga sp.]